MLRKKKAVCLGRLLAISTLYLDFPLQKIKASPKEGEERLALFLGSLDYPENATGTSAKRLYLSKIIPIIS